MAKKNMNRSCNTPRERFCFYLKNLFEDNQRRMAQDTSLSQAVISKIVLGKQDPGSRVLKLLSQHPKVNPAWLVSGEGDPLLADRKSYGEGGWPLPIAEALLPGPTASCQEFLTSQIELVSGAVYRDSAYIYVLPNDILAEQMRVGDRILLDSDPKRWRRNLQVLDNKLCAVRLHKASGPYIKLLRVHCVFSNDAEDAQLQVAGPPIETVDEDQGKESRSIELDEQPSVSSKPPTKDVIAVDDIMAIAIQLIRKL